MPYSHRNGVEIYYEVTGSGPPLVLIHAMPFDHHLWLYQVDRFSEQFTTIAMDLRGWGRSAKPHESYDLRAMADDVIGVMRDCHASRSAVVMGCSVGSKIALMLACDHPDIFAAAVLVGGNSGPQNQFAHRIAAYKAHGAAGTLADYHRGHLRYGVTQAWADSEIGACLIDGFVARGRGLDGDAIARVFEALGPCDLNGRLPAYRTPTFVVNGAHDGALPGGTRTAELIANSEHLIIANAGHCCFIEKPGVFNTAVADFLSRHGLLE